MREEKRMLESGWWPVGGRGGNQNQAGLDEARRR